MRRIGKIISYLTVLMFVLLEVPRETSSMGINSHIFGISQSKYRNTIVSLRGGSDDDTSSDDEEDQITDNEDTEEGEIKANKTISNVNVPIKVTIRTNINIPLLDSNLELMASPKRNVQSIKTSISRQMISRPPISLQRILLGTRELADEELLYDLIEDDEDEEQEAILNLILDTPIPPIDPKFAIQEQHFFEKLREMSTNDILDLYIGNMISMFYLKQQMMYNTTDTSAALPNNIQMKKDIIAHKEYFISILNDEIRAGLDGRGMDEEGINDEGDGRTRRAARIKGGAKMTVKRTIQKNLNINWADTIRNSILFIFFGYFGTRDAITQKVMIYYCAPLCFIVQLRIIKIFFKQLFYMLNNGPTFILSLLPVPLQILLGMDVWECMDDLYPGWNEDGDDEVDETDFDDDY